MFENKQAYPLDDKLQITSQGKPTDNSFIISISNCIASLHIHPESLPSAI